MVDWKSAEDALSDPKFHDQDLESKRDYLANLGGFGTLQDIDSLLSDSYNKYAVPREQRFTKKITQLTPNAMGKFTKVLPAPEDPIELVKDPTFHKQPEENKKAQMRMVMPEFGRLPDQEQTKILGEAWDKYYRPSNPAPTPKPILPEPPTQDWTQIGMEAKQAADKESAKYLGEMGHQFWEGVKGGTQGVGQAAGGGLQLIGHLVDSDTLEKWGQDTNNWLDRVIEVDETPQDLAGSIMDKPYLMADPRWWARNIGNLVPNAALFMAGGMGAGVIARAALGATASAAKVGVLTSLINSVYNATYMGASQYVDDKKAGATDEQAAKSAAFTATTDLPWTFLTTLPIFGAAMRSTLANVTKNFLSEGTQEAGEQVIQNYASKEYGKTDRELGAGVPESFVIGGLAGPLVGKVSEMAMGPGAEGDTEGRPNMESVITLQKQINAVLKGHRLFVMFQHSENTPDSIKGLDRLDYKVSGIDNDGNPVDIDSTFFFDPKRTSAKEIKYALDNKYMKNLGIVDEKSPETKHVVAAIDKDGNELVSYATKEEHINEQKEEVQRQFPPSDPANAGSVIVSGEVEKVMPIIEELRNRHSIDERLEVSERINRIMDGTEASPDGVRVELNEVKTPAEEKSPEQAAEELKVVPSEEKPEGERVPEEILPETPAAKTEVPQEKASVPFMVTNASRQALADLGWASDQIDSMTPAKALEHIENNTRPDQMSNPPSIDVTREETFAPPPTPEGLHESQTPFPNPVVEKPAIPEKVVEKPAKPKKTVKYKKKETKKEFVNRMAGDIDGIREGYEIVTDDGIKYVRGEGGWQKLAKNGNPSGAPTKSKSLFGKKIKISAGRLAELVELGRKHAEEAKTAATEKLLNPPPPIEESMPYVDVYGKEGNIVNIDMKPKGKAKGVADKLTKALGEATQNPLDIAQKVESGEVEMDEPLPAGTPLERADEDYSGLVTTSQGVAPVDSGIKKVKVWAKKSKGLPAPAVDEVALQEKPAVPVDLTPTAKTTEPRPISKRDYEVDRKNLVDVKDRIAGIEQDIKDRTNSGVSTKDRTDFNLDDLQAKVDRLKKLQVKLENNIREYETAQDIENPPETPQLVYPESEAEADPRIKESFEAKPKKLSQEELDQLGNEYMAAKTDDEREAIVKKLLNKADEDMSMDDGVGELIVHLEDSALTTEEFSHVQDTLDELLGPVQSEEELSGSVDRQLSAADVDPNTPQMALLSGLKMKSDDAGRNIRVRDNVDGKMLGIRGIVVRLAKALDIPLRFKLKAPGMDRTKGIGGYFLPKAETIHLNSRDIARSNDTELDIVPHEIGHYMDLVWLRDGKAANLNGIPSFGTQYDSEINQIGEAYYTRVGVDPSTVPPATLRSEGIAEFFRRFMGMTQPQIENVTVDGKTTLSTASRVKLQQDAPGFYDMVMKTLDKYPDILNIVNRATQDIHDYLSSDLLTQAKADIHYSSDYKPIALNTIPERIGSFFFNLRRLWENRLLPQERDVKKMMRLDPSRKDNLEYVIRMIRNERGKTEEQAKYSLEKNWIDNDGNEDPEVGSVVSILKDVDDFRALDVYLRAVNAREIEKPRLIPGTKTLAKQRSSGMPKAHQDAAIAAYGSKYYEVAKKLTEWANRNLHLLVEEGRISEQTYNKIVNTRQMYAPQWKVLELMGVEGVGGSKASPMGVVNLPAGPMFVKGGEGPIYSPIESFLKNSINIRGISRKVKYFESWTQAAEAVQGHGRVIEQLKGDTQIQRISHNEVIAKLQENKVNTELLIKEIKKNLKLSEDQDVDLSIIMYDTVHNTNPADQTVLHHRKGEPVMFKVANTDTYNSLTGQDAKLWGFNKTMAGKILQFQTKVLRASSIMHPNFSIRNFLKDPISAFVYSHFGYNPLDQGKIIAEAITNSKAYGDDFHRNGGGMGDMMSQDMDSLQKTIDSILGENKSLKDKYADKWARATSPADKVRFAWEITGEAGLQKLQSFSHILEEMTRIGLYNRTLNVLTKGDPSKATKEQIEIAINEGKETTLPYHISGTAGAELNRLDAFFNAAMQDTAKFLKEHTWEHVKITYNKDLKLGENLRENFYRNTVMKGMAYHLPLAALTFLLGKDDDKIKNLPAWRKASAWNINIGRLTGNKDWILSIPKSFLIGQFYGSSVEGVLYWLHDKDESASRMATKWAKGVWNAAAPSVMMNGPLPLIENWVNYHMFTDSQLESEAMQDINAEYRATPSTSAIAKTIAHGTGWTGRFADSPVKIDNIIRGWFGAGGKTIVDGLGWGIAALSANSTPIPTKTLREHPVVSAISISPYTPSDYVRRFYDASEIAAKRMKTFTSFNRAGQTDEQREFYNENKKLINWYSGDPSTRGSGAMSAIAKAKKELSNISKEMAVVQANKHMSSDRKQERLLKLSAMRDRVAERNFKTLFHKEDKEAVY